MAQEHINLGTPPSGVDGDTDRAAWTKAEANFNELYGYVGTGDGSLTNQVQQNTDDIATLQPQVATNTSDLATVKPQVTQNTTDITTNKNNITTNTNDIATLQPQVATNTTNIGTLQTQMAAVNPAGSFKNKLINGNFYNWQRGTAFAPGATTGLTYTADRWFLQRNAMSTPQVSQNPYTAPGDSTAAGLGSPFGALVASSANTDVAGHYYIVGQYLEDVQRLAGKTVTLSIRAYNSNATARTIAAEICQVYDPGGSNALNGIGSQKLTFPQGWSMQKLTVTIPPTGSVTLQYPKNYTALLLWFSAGTNYNSRSANLGAQTGDLLLGAVQLEEGSQVTALEIRPQQTEIALCQRYYQKSYTVTTTPGSSVSIGQQPYRKDFLSATANTQTIRGDFKVTMRAQPTFTVYDSAGTAGKVSYYQSTWKNNGNPGSLMANTPGFAMVFTGLAVDILGLEFNWTADAEI